jgi:hypothetical protein
MAIKEKNAPPPVPEPSKEGTVLHPERMMRINPQIDAAINDWMASHPEEVAHYTNLVKNNPERAIRTLCLPKVMSHQNQMKVVDLQTPAALAWAKSIPGMMEKAAEKLQNIKPFYRPMAQLRVLKKLKTDYDFAPAPAKAAQGNAV